MGRRQIPLLRSRSWIRCTAGAFTLANRYHAHDLPTHHGGRRPSVIHGPLCSSNDAGDFSNPFCVQCMDTARRMRVCPAGCPGVQRDERGRIRPRQMYPPGATGRRSAGRVIRSLFFISRIN